MNISSVGVHSCGKREARWIHRRTTRIIIYLPTYIHDPSLHATYYMLHDTCYISHTTYYLTSYYKLHARHKNSLGLIGNRTSVNPHCLSRFVLPTFPSLRYSLFLTIPASGRSCDVIFALCMPLFSSGPWPSCSLGCRPGTSMRSIHAGEIMYIVQVLSISQSLHLSLLCPFDIYVSTRAARAQ